MFTEPTEAHVRIGKWAQDFAVRVYHNLPDNESVWLVLVGETGTGKTHLAKAIANFIALSAVDLWHTGKWSKIPTVSSFEWSELMEKDSTDTFREACEASLLVIDDIGAEADRFKSGQPTEVLRRLMSKREGRWTIWTTNVGKDQWKDRWDARVDSRLKDSKVLLFNGLSDFRTKPKA